MKKMKYRRWSDMEDEVGTHLVGGRKPKDPNLHFNGRKVAVYGDDEVTKMR